MSGVGVGGRFYARGKGAGSEEWVGKMGGTVVGVGETVLNMRGGSGRERFDDGEMRRMGVRQNMQGGEGDVGRRRLASSPRVREALGDE